jgi:hypothetical protein
MEEDGAVSEDTDMTVKVRGSLSRLVMVVLIEVDNICE